MLTQLLVGFLITFFSLAVGAGFWWGLNALLERMEDWLCRPPHAFKSLLVIWMVVVSAMVIMTLGVALWALVFHDLRVFSTFEEAAYYSLVAYTTLGLGDVVVPVERRLLGGITGANGFLMFGLMTAMLTDTLRHIRNLHRG